MPSAEYQREWRKAHRERVLAYHRAYYKRHRKERCESAKKFRMNHLEQVRAIHRRYFLAHREKFKKYHHDHYERTKARRIKYAIARNKKYPEKARAAIKQWRTNHLQQSRKYCLDYYARRCGAKGSHTLEQWVARIEFYGSRCAYCAKRLTPKTVEKDHQIPLSKGGTNWAANLVPACRGCNSHKNARSPNEIKSRRANSQ